MPEDGAGRAGSHLTRLMATRTLARMPARPVRGLRLAAVACALAAALAGAAAAAGPIPTPIGVGARYHPAVGTVPVAGLRCTSAEVPRFGVHLELFADRRVGARARRGSASRRRCARQGAYVLGGRCSYPLRTREPTGVVEVAARRDAPLGDLFRVWGQPLVRSNRLVGFALAVPSSRSSTGAASRATRARSRSARTPRSCSSSAATSRPTLRPLPGGTREPTLVLAAPAAALGPVAAGCGGSLTARRR